MCLSGVDRMQRNFEPMRKQVEAWQRGELAMSFRVIDVMFTSRSPRIFEYLNVMAKRFS